MAPVKRFLKGELGGAVYGILLGLVLWAHALLMAPFPLSEQADRQPRATELMRVLRMRDPSVGSVVPGLPKEKRIVVLGSICDVKLLFGGPSVPAEIRADSVVVIPVMRRGPGADHGFEIAADPDMRLHRLLNPFFRPRVYVLNTRGRLAWVQPRPMPTDALIKEIQRRFQ